MPLSGEPPICVETCYAGVAACECGAVEWQMSATLIGCKRCGRHWGRVNGAWVLDGDSVPESQMSREDWQLVRWCVLTVSKGFATGREGQLAASGLLSKLDRAIGMIDPG